MHEISLTLSILDITEEYASRYQFDHINTLKLSFGRMSCIEPKSLEFAFELQSKGTRAEGATLEFEILPITIYCFCCESEYKLDTFSSICPHCNSQEVLLVGGTEELKLVEMDVD